MTETSGCILPPFQFTPFHLFLIIFVLLAILTGYWIYKAFKFYQNPFSRTMATTISLIFFLITSIIIFFFFAIFLEETEWPPSYKYHQVHAAIKNTCYLDPEKKNCPKNAEEIVRLYPEEFGPLLNSSAVTYQYDQQTKSFTLLIRDRSSINGEYQVSIFDRRLTQTGNSSPGYGYGVDFYDTKIMRCSDKYEIIDKPPFHGPWSEIN